MICSNNKFSTRRNCIWTHTCKYTPQIRKYTFTFRSQWHIDAVQHFKFFSKTNNCLKTASWANIVFPLLYIFQLKNFLHCHVHVRWHRCHRRQRNDDHSWRTTCLSPQAARSSPLAPNRVASIKGRSGGVGGRSRRQRRPLATMMGWFRFSMMADSLFKT